MNHFCACKYTHTHTHTHTCKALEHEATVRTQHQAALSNQQLLLRQALVQNSELNDRLVQIQSLASGVEPPRMMTPSLAGVRRTTPAKSMPRLDSFMSLHSTVSDKFFDALDDVSGIYMQLVLQSSMM